MTTIQLAFALLVCAMFIGFLMPSWWCLVIAIGMALALWHEDRTERREEAAWRADRQQRGLE